MTTLNDTHPDVHQQLINGEFCVQRSDASFSQAAADQAIEQTANRDSKSKGPGMIGFSRNPGAVHKRIVTSHHRAEIVKSVKEMVDLTGLSQTEHKDCSKSKIAHLEASVEAVLQTINSWTDPFAEQENNSDMINISSGVVAPPPPPQPVVHDLLRAQEVGEHHLCQFIDDRLKSEKVKFFAPLPKLKLRTFASMLQTKSVKMGTTNVTVRADRHLMARMLVVAQNRSMDLHHVLSYELGPVPCSIATVDGGLVKTTKSSLLSLLEKDVPVADGIPNEAAWMV